MRGIQISFYNFFQVDKYVDAFRKCTFASLYIAQLGMLYITPFSRGFWEEKPFAKISAFFSKQATPELQIKWQISKHMKRS